MKQSEPKHEDHPIKNNGSVPFIFLWSYLISHSYILPYIPFICLQLYSHYFHRYALLKIFTSDITLGHMIQVRGSWMWKQLKGREGKGQPWMSLATQSFHSSQWHVQNATIPCRSQELLSFLSAATILPSSLTSSCHLFLGHVLVFWFQIHIQYSFGNSVFFHSLYMSKPV
jgi:hypothetical protein